MKKSSVKEKWNNLKKDYPRLAMLIEQGHKNVISKTSCPTCNVGIGEKCISDNVQLFDTGHFVHQTRNEKFLSRDYS